MEFKFDAELWVYPGDGAWVFVTLPLDISTEIKKITKYIPRKGFGSVKVIVSTEGIEWRTSIFPDNKSKSYLLPIKKEVRSMADLSPGDIGFFKIQIVDLL